MTHKILKNPNILKIFLIFQDGKNNKRKESVKIKYIDEKHCYFTGESIQNFSKPKWRAKADIIIYTPNGTYSANVIIRDTSFSLKEMMYKLDIPKEWKHTQLRAGSRKAILLPIVITFSDDTEIQTETFDISVSGFSILDKQVLNSIQTRFPCSCSIQFPVSTIINFPEGILTTSAKYIREKPIIDNFELRDHKQLCFKFTALSPEESLILKNFLMSIE